MTCLCMKWYAGILITFYPPSLLEAACIVAGDVHRCTQCSGLSGSAGGWEWDVLAACTLVGSTRISTSMEKTKA
jgi:hypothetical protein